MRRGAMSTTRTVAMIAVGVLVITGGVWGISAWSGESKPDKPALPPELTVEALKKQAEQDPGTAFRAMRDIRDRQDLTEEQQRQAADNARRVMEQQMDKNLDEYYAAASEEERLVVLDRQIDDWVERMKKMREEWEKERQEREARGEKEDENEQRERGRRMWGGPQTRDERKVRSESRSPDSQARRMAYFQMAHKRMTERGIEMPFGPRGGRGGTGGPRGDRGPGGPPGH